MKKLFFTVIVLVFFACNNDVPKLEVQGKWKLMKVENPFAQRSTDFSTENIIFNFGVSTVNISGNQGDFYIDNGDYPYTLEMQNSLSPSFQTLTLTLKGTRYTYTIEKNQMILSNAYVDGDVLTFIRQ